MTVPKTNLHFFFIINNYPPKTGGVETHVSNLAQKLVELGQRCTVVTLSKSPSRNIESGVEVIRVQQGFGFGDVISFPTFAALREIKKLFFSELPDLVSTHTRFFPMTWIGIHFARQFSIPVIHTEHGSGFVKGVNLVVGVMSRLVDFTLGCKSLRKSTKVLAVSENVSDFVMKLSGVSSEVFYNAVNLPEQNHISTRGKLNETPRFVFVGRLVPGKGADDLISAASVLSQQGMNLRVEIVGDGPESEKLQVLSEKLGLSKQVVFLGETNHEQVMKLLEQSVYVNPTVLSEGFQTTLLEAVSVGAQIVTYQAPGVNQLIQQKAPIHLAKSRSISELATLMKQAAGSPLPRIDSKKLETWGWDYRAMQYQIIAESTAQFNC